MRNSTSQRSWRQNLAQGEASGALGRDPIFHQARFSGRKNLSPAKAGLRITLWRVPRAAFRFTSFRFTCPGLNSAAGYAGSLSLILLSLTIACAKKEPQNKTAGAPTPSAPSENYPNLTTQAKEVSDAFARKDYERFADLTYPKVIEMVGGREKMLSELNRQLKEMESEGVVVISSTSGAPTQFLHDSGSIYAVLPMTLKAKARDGVFQADSTMIGISSDGGASWTFIDAGGKDQSELKKLLPNVADRLNLPLEKKPVKIENS